MVCLFHFFVPGGTLQSMNFWVQEANQVEKRIKKLYKHLANQRAQPTRIPALIMGECWQLPLVRCPRVSGASPRT